MKYTTINYSSIQNSSKLNINKIERSLESVNHVLLITLVLLGGYIMLIPFIPEFELYLRQSNDKTQGFKYQSRLAKSQQEAGQLRLGVVTLPDPPAQNTLIIPSIGVDSPIVEGLGHEALNAGLWHRPNSSNPSLGGNTVITGHRFMYTSGPKTFYNLDKLKIGDKFIIYWDKKEYDYEVYDIYVVTPDKVEIEQNTESEIVTLYTCTPMWSSSHRLVVRAKKIQI